MITSRCLLLTVRPCGWCFDQIQDDLLTRQDVHKRLIHPLRLVAQQYNPHRVLVCSLALEYALVL